MFVGERNGAQVWRTPALHRALAVNDADLDLRS